MDSIAVFSVGFGDCFLLNNDNQGILVDCGSKNYKKSEKKEVAESIQRFCQDNCIDLSSVVITHFHEDHYNILGSLTGASISTLYIPDFFSFDEIKLEFLQLMIQPRKSLYFKRANEILLLLPSLLKLPVYNRKLVIKCVKRGDRIDSVPNPYSVLWPDVRKAFDPEAVVLFILQSLLDISTSAEELSAYADELTNQYYDCYIRAANQSKTNDIVIGQERIRIASEMNAVINKAISFNEKNNLGIKLSGNIKSQISRIQNAISIVFETGTDLFLGDITQDIFDNRILNDVANKQYRAIKVAHHGTKRHYTEKLPQSCYLIISNGKYKGWDLTAMYPLRYANRKFICTNCTGCEYWQATSGTKSVHEFQCGIHTPFELL